MNKPGFMLSLILLCSSMTMAQTPWQQRIIRDTRSSIMARAAWAMQQMPVTITAYRCERSAGGLHDFYSEGDYWWPDPANPSGPYIQRDGQSNPDNFTAHREAMVRFSRVMGALAAAYVATKDNTWLQQARKHARAWFTDTATRMHPSLLYAQAIKGRATGRGIGIIDTIHLLEVVQALRIMEKAGVLPPEELAACKAWFREYLHWMTTHPYGKDEMNAANNHGTCWVMQVAAYSLFVQDSTLTTFCKKRYEEVLIPGQMAADGSFPRELARTKPYGYALFNLDAMATINQLLGLYASDAPIERANRFMFPYVQDKNSWPYAKDVMYWDQWPVAHPFLLFAAVALNNETYYQCWLRLEHNPQEAEVLRNLPVRNPVIWLQ